MGLQRATAPAIVRPPPSMRGVGPILSRKNPLRRRLASTRKVDQLALPGVKIRTSVSLARSSESVESKHTSIDLVSVRTRPKVSLASYSPRLISHFTASAPKELPERVTSRVPRVCQTWLRALRTDPVTEWSGWAKRDHQRTMINVHGHFTGCLSGPSHASTFAAASSPSTKFSVHRGQRRERRGRRREGLPCVLHHRAAAVGVVAGLRVLLPRR